MRAGLVGSPESRTCPVDSHLCHHTTVTEGSDPSEAIGASG